MNLKRRIDNFTVNHGYEPKYLILSQIEMVKLKIDLKPLLPLGSTEEIGEIKEFMGIPVIEVKNCLLPEDL